MDPKHFDKLAEVVGRRKILGGALAGLLGLGTVRLADAAKGHKGKKQDNKKQEKKKSKNEVGKEAVCTGINFDPPGPGECPSGSCCSSTPAGNNVACTDVFTQLAGTQQLCGDLNGEGVCRTCPQGTRCGANPFTGDLSCICNPGSCPNGCCYQPLDFAGQPAGDQQCIVNGSGTPLNTGDFNDGSFVCGTGGSTCNFCSVGPQVFSGCCSSTGVCQAGTATTNCGTGGKTCAVCTGTNAQCGISQSCTAEPPPPPCAAGLTQCTTGTPPTQICVDLSNNSANCGACGRACPASGNRAGICVGGSCTLGPAPAVVAPAPTCVAPNTFCGGVCVSTLSNPNCGGCGRVCKSCNSGVCVNKKKKKKHHKH